jgi:hypothetical protein
VVTAAVALAGCTSMAMAVSPSFARSTTQSAASAVAGTASATSSNAATAPALAPRAPTQILEGDCSALFPETAFSHPAMAEVLGENAVHEDPFLDAPNLQAVPTLGGLDCTWWGAGKDAEAASVTAVVLSRSFAGDAEDSVTCEVGAVTMPDDTSTCRFGFVAGSLWLSGTVLPRSGTPERDTRAAVAVLGEAFRTLSSEISVAASGPLPDGAWTPPACSELSAAAAVTSTLNSPDLLVSDVQTSGSESVPGVHAANDAAGVFACAWFRSGEEPAGAVDGFSVLSLPGGAWAESRALAVPGAAVVDLPGVDLAVRMPTAEGHDLIDVFDGVNWVQVGGTGSLEAVLPAIPDLVDALDAHGAS